MKTIINILEKERKKIVEHIKSGDKNYLEKLKELDKAINWIKKLDELNIENVQKYNIIKLPNMGTGWSEYRIMNDCETDNRQMWIELKINNEKLYMTWDDIVIIKK